MKRCLFTSSCTLHYENQCLGYHDQNLAYKQFDVEYSSKWWWKPNYLCVKITIVCWKCKEMVIILYWPSKRTNPMTSRAVVLQDGGALAPKAITKQPFFFFINHVCYFFYQSGNYFTKQCKLSWLLYFYFKSTICHQQNKSIKGIVNPKLKIVIYSCSTKHKKYFEQCW